MPEFPEPPDEALEQGDEYAKLVTVSGEQYYEVGVKIPGGTSYLTEDVEVTPDMDGGEIRRRVDEALEDLHEEIEEGQKGDPIDEYDIPSELSF